MNIIVPIGGVGKRFTDDNYDLPKPLIRAKGKPVIFWNLDNLKVDNDDIIFIVYRKEFEIYNFEDVITNKFRSYNFKFIQIQNDTRGASETVLYAINQMNKKQLNDLTLVVDSDNFYNDDIIESCKKINNNLIFYKKDYDNTPIYSYIQISDEGEVLDIKEKEKISNNACVGAYCFSNSNLLKSTITSVILQERKQKNEYYISSLYKYLIEKKINVFSEEISGFNCLGTPNQLKSFSSNFNIDGYKYRFCFDLDNTLVSYPKIEGDYSSVEPIKRVINFSNFLYDQGHTIIIHTARRMRTHAGNVGRVQADIAKITYDTLDKFDIKYHEIYFGKPYAQFYIDDLAVSTFSDLEKETGFYNIHPKTRDHNSIEIFDNYIIKTSEYIDGEKYFYQNIPNISKKYFPELLGYDNNSIKLSKIEGIPISFLNTSGILTEKILSNLFTSLDFLHQNKPNESNINIYSNYLNKFNKRIDSYDFSSYDGFIELKNELIQFLDKYETEKRGIVGLIHGDPVLTNTLIDSKDYIKFIDMRGKLGNELSIYGDIFYDWAKLYQSIIGYDYILMDKDLNYDNINKNKLIFENFIVNKFGEDKLDDIKQITKSLILTLIPIHNNHRCQMFYNLIKTI